MTVKKPSDLSHDELVNFVETLQRILYWENSWNPEKEHDSDTLADIASLVAHVSLIPTNSPGERPAP